MPVPWPTSFPQLFQVSGATLQPVSNATPVDTESGEPMSRVRFTGEMDSVVASVQCENPDVAASIRSFWRYDLKNGTLTFIWDDPISGELTEYLMMAPPKFTPISQSAGMFLAELTLQSMPT